MVESPGAVPYLTHLPDPRRDEFGALDVRCDFDVDGVAEGQLVAVLHEPRQDQLEVCEFEGVEGRGREREREVTAVAAVQGGVGRRARPPRNRVSRQVKLVSSIPIPPLVRPSRHASHRQWARRAQSLW